MKLQKLFDSVGEFNEAFSVPEQRVLSHRIIDADKLLYYKLMKEENEEYEKAVKDRDLVEVADALTDELYILIGKFRKHGFSAELTEKLFDEVHASNMSKLGPDGRPIRREDGKVLKGEDYFKPAIARVLKDAEK